MLNQKLRTMRNIFKFMLFIAAGAMILVSCEEDKFTEKDAMESLQTIDVALTIQDGTSYAEGVEGATVKVLKDSSSSSTLEKTTDASGYVMFEDMKIGGDISVYVNKDNYTKALFQVSTSTNSYRESQISKTVKIYPLDGENMATVEGQLTIETDLTNRVREKLANQEVKVINHGLGGNIEKSFVGTTDEEGKYSIKVPVNADGSDDLTVYGPTKIDTAQTLAMNEKVISKPTVYYSDNYNPSQIPFVSSAVASIDAPTDVGSGFELGVKAKGTSFKDHSVIELIQGGSGYHIENATDTLLPMSEGINGDTTWARIFISKSGSDSSSITNIDVPFGYDNGLYISEPSLDLSVLGGSGAMIDIRFESEYMVYIKNNGSGYKSIPTVSATYKEYQGSTIVKEVDEDLSSYDAGDYNELHQYGNSYYRFNNFINLHNGSLYPSNNAYEQDTLFITRGLTEKPELSVASAEGQKAKIRFNDNDINHSDSTITDFYLDKNGQGYDPANPPEVTVTSLSGYGSNAEFYVEVNSDGSIYYGNIDLKDGGKGYIRNVNDYVNSGIELDHQWDNWGEPGQGQQPYHSSNPSDVSPGDVVSVEIYYGTGIRQSEE
jgi:hypothetical protein